MKTIICALLLAVVASPVYAVSSSVIKNTAGTEVFSINYTAGAATVAVNGVISPTTISASGNATVSGTLGVTGASTFGPVTFTSEVEISSTSLSVTTAQTIALSAPGVIKLDASGQGDTTTTNTLPAVAAGYVGNLYVLVNVGTSNSVLITDVAPVYNDATALGPNDSAIYYVVATNVIQQVGGSNN